MTTITLRQALSLVEFFGGHDCEVTIASELPGTPSAPRGLYAWCSEYPEEGAQFLGPTEVDDELARNGLPRNALRASHPLAAGSCLHNVKLDQHCSACANNGVRSGEAPSLKDHQIAQTVNALTALAREFHATEQLRDRIANIIVPILKGEGFPKSIVNAYAPPPADGVKVIPSVERINIEDTVGAAFDAQRPSIARPGMGREKR